METNRIAKKGELHWSNLDRGNRVLKSLFLLEQPEELKELSNGRLILLMVKKELDGSRIRRKLPIIKCIIKRLFPLLTVLKLLQKIMTPAQDVPVVVS